MSDAALLGPEALLELVQEEIDAESALLDAAMDTWLAAPAVRKSVETFLQKSLIALVRSGLMGGTGPEGKAGIYDLSVAGVAQQIHGSNAKVQDSFTVDQISYAVRKVALEAGYDVALLHLGYIRVGRLEGEE